MSRGEVIVVGGGLAGLASAYALHEAGYAVRVLERREDVALETSFANGGILTPSMPDPWNAPGVHWQLLRWLGREDAPMLLRPSRVLSYLGWGLQFLAASAPRSYEASMRANYRLCAYSLERLRTWRAVLGLEYAAGTHGTIEVYRDPGSFAHAVAEVRSLSSLGLVGTPLDPAGTARLEPLLDEIRADLAGAIHYPADESGDALLFCRALRERLEARGVKVSCTTPVRAVRVRAGRVAGVETGGGFVPGSDVVLAAGPWSRALLAACGVRVQVQPVKGYSLSIPIDPRAAPRHALSDDSLHAVMTPLGPTLRLAGTAEFSGWDTRLLQGRVESLWRLLAALNPTLARTVARSSARPWCGLRPMSADGRPYIGATPVAGLYVNTGHGHLGWTQAAGSAALLAQLMSGAPTAIDPRPFALSRTERRAWRGEVLPTEQHS
ncbi:MAG TPA: FAD-dependent oxidoreductase [Steroidobacteraceae bacterium]|nr:FAD-dependent oxidoreductase [Steroidobacteraceae bacterium]